MAVGFEGFDTMGGFPRGDDWDSPGPYQSPNIFRYSGERKPKPVDVKPNLKESFVVDKPSWTLAHEANAQREEGYVSITIKPGQLVWRAQCWDINERNLQSCYMTKIDGKIFFFHDLMEKGTELVPVSMARAIFMHMVQNLSGNR